MIDPDTNHQESLQQVVKKFARRELDLESPPLLRSELLRLADDEHIALFLIHHLISDGWSTGILAKELSAIYNALVMGTECVLPPLTIQYTDFAQWQRESLEKGAESEDLAYWKKQLAGAQTILEIPADGIRPAYSNAAGSHEWTIPAETVCRIRALSREEGMTVFMIVLASFQLLLARYASQEDICVGSPIANRNRSDLEGLIGFFVNTLVLRAKLHGNPSFRELAMQVKDVCLGAYAHQDLPFERLVSELNPARSLSATPLFQVMFLFQNTPAPILNLYGVEIEDLKPDEETTEFELECHFWEEQEALKFKLVYNTSLFYPETVEWMGRNYLSLLASVTARPDGCIWDFPLMENREEESWLREFCGVPMVETRLECLHELFSRQARAVPGLTAIEYQGRCWTYSEIEEQSSRMAAGLIARGVAQGSTIGVWLNGGPTQVVVLLGILKAGCAFVCFSRKEPPAMVQSVMDEVESPLLIVSSETLTPDSALRIALQDQQRELAYIEGDGEISGLLDWRDHSTRPVSPSEIAFIAYTSGSTGKPKGIIQSHRNFSQFVSWFGKEFDLRPGKRVAQWASYSHDSAYAETFGALCHGATLCMMEDPGKGDPLAVARWVEAARISLLQTAPSFGEQLLQTIESQMDGLSFSSLEYFLLAGEVLKTDFASAWLRRFAGRVKIYNLYGPTESVLATFYRVNAVERGRRAVPIGRPIEGRRILVIDRHHQLCPVGIIGEIYIASAYLSHGYLSRPEETGASFLQNPLHSDYPEIVYRTGDLGRWLPDGNLDFWGRMDWQVKIRGQRVEIAEIEAILSRQQEVRECAVVARQFEDGARLVSFVTPNPGATMDTRRLRASLATKLHDYMLPVIVWIDDLPYLPNGKVDRAKLAELSLDRLKAANTEAPRTAVEEIVWGIWRNLLQIEGFGVHDNFFDLGGHSLLATKVVARIRETFQSELSLRAFFESPTVAGLAALIEESREPTAERRIPAITPVSRDGPLPLSFAQQRLWFVQELSPDSGFYNMTSAFRLQGELDFNAIKCGLAEIIRRHETLRTRFELIDGTPMQQICSHYEWRLEVLDYTKLGLQAARSFLQDENTRAFDLRQTPQLRATLLQLGRQDHVLVIVVHHIAYDGWSDVILFRELATLYQAFHERRPSPLPELKIQYADYAFWQRHWLEDERLEMELAYWKKQLAGAPRLELPLDNLRSKWSQHPGESRVTEVAEPLSEELRRLARMQGVTLFMLLLAVFKALLTRYSGVTDVVVGSPMAGRNLAETEDLIGFFVNMLVLRTDLSGNPKFHELLGRVREVALGAYAHQEVPFDKLVEELNPDRDLSRNPFYEIVFALHNLPLEPIVATGLKISPFEYERNTAPIDLSCHVREISGRLLVTLNYNTELFEAATIDRMALHLRNLMESIVEHPDFPLSELRMMDDRERAQLLTENQGAEVDFGKTLSVTELFEAQVKTTPDAIALVCDAQQLTYLGLNRKVNQLAHYLRAAGVGPELPVALFLERSAETVIAALAILKAGSAYLPLDVGSPLERLQFMLEDSATPLALSTEHLAETLPSVRCVYLDREWPEIAAQSTEDLGVPIDPDNLAYIIYTSGSTGYPKGVGVSHRGLTNHMRWMARYFRLQPDDSVLQKTITSFDASVWELFLPLITGTRLVVASPTAHLNIFQLAAEISRYKVSILQLAPSILRLMVDESLIKQCPTLRKICCGGEALTPDLAQRVWEEFPVEIVNLYGPTEATIEAVVWSSDTPRQKLGSRTPIGKPIANTRVCVVDERMELAPVGAVGELLIGGEGLARGYRNRPDMTAERFGPDPFSGRAGERLYRTGDLVRWRADQTLEYLGRVDNQVKLHGCRIELGEIEAVLREQPGIRDAAVVVQEEAGREPILIAYWVAQVGWNAERGGLYSGLASRLPTYMLPTMFLQLESLPLMPNGKLDRRLLPVAKVGGDEPGQSLSLPETETEKVIADVWRDLLKVDQLSIEANFFDLGGSSLIAIQLLSRLNELLSVDLQVADIFQFPTISAMAGYLSGIQPPVEEVSTNNLARAEKKNTAVRYWREQISVRHRNENPGQPPVSSEVEEK